MKISAKLILLISLAFIGCLVVGGVALGQLSTLNTEIRTLSDKTINGTYGGGASVLSGSLGMLRVVPSRLSKTTTSALPTSQPR